MQHLVAALQRQVGDDTHQIGIAAAFADAVDGPLHLSRPAGRPPARELATATSQSLWQWMPSSTRRRRRASSTAGRDLLRQRAAVGVAQDDHRRPGVLGGPQRLQGVVAVAAQPVEEVLGVVKHLAPGRLAVGHGVGDHVQVFFQADVQHLADLHVPRLADDGDDRRAGVEQRLEAHVLGGADPLAPRHAEGRDPGVLQRQLAHLLEILEVLGVGQRIAALDEVDAEFVEAAGDVELVHEGEVDALALAAVTKGRVVDGDARHGAVLAKKKP